MKDRIMKSINVIFYSLLGAWLPVFVVLYLVGIANLGMTGLPRALVELFPLVLFIGGCVGIGAARFRVHGCMISSIAGVATLAAVLATAFATDTSHVGFIIPPRAYMIGGAIGSVLGLSLLFSVYFITQRMRQQTAS